MLTQRDVRSVPLAFSSHQGNPQNRLCRLRKHWDSCRRMLTDLKMVLVRRCSETLSPNLMQWYEKTEKICPIFTFVSFQTATTKITQKMIFEGCWSPLTLNVWTNEDRIFIFGYYFKMHNIAYFPNDTLVQSIKIIVYWNKTIILYTQKFYILWLWEMTANVKMCRISNWITNEYILKKKSRLIMSSFTLVMKS